MSRKATSANREGTPMNRLLEAVLREDFGSFVRKVFATVCPGTRYLHNWHIEAIAHRLMQVHRGLCLRLLINQPPRSLKSLCVSIAYVAWTLGRDPTRRIIVVSYSGEFAAELHRQFRVVINSDWYRALFPNLHWAKETGLELVTTRGGGRYATSIGGTLTGRGADLIILDDPLNAADAYSEPARKRVVDWYGGSLVSRLNSKVTGAIVGVMQRLHQEDLAGHFKEQGGWDCLDLPAIAEVDELIPLGHGQVHQRKVGDILHPQREGRAALDAIKTEIGSDAFFAQYQQMPVPPGGAMIKRAWIRRYSARPAKHEILQIYQSWDTAMKGGPSNDYSVCTTWAQTSDCKLYLLDVWRARVDYPTLKAQVLKLDRDWLPSTILMEEAGTAIGLLDELRYECLGLIGVKPARDKIARMAIASAKFEAGNIFLPEAAPWLADLEAELFAFPGARHDDQCDSISQAVNDDSAASLATYIRAYGSS
jgi:predicted phage terminase large subunit-like protein